MTLTAHARGLLSATIDEQIVRIDSLVRTYSFWRYLARRNSKAWYRLCVAVLTLALLATTLGLGEGATDVAVVFGIYVGLMLLGVGVDFREWYLQNAEMAIAYRSQLEMFKQKISQSAVTGDDPFQYDIESIAALLREKGYYENLNCYSSLMRETVWPCLDRTTGSFTQQHALLCVKDDILDATVATFLPDFVKCHAGTWSVNGQHLVEEAHGTNPVRAGIYARTARFSTSALSVRSLSLDSLGGSQYLHPALGLDASHLQQRHRRNIPCIVLDETPLRAVSKLIIDTIETQNRAGTDHNPTSRHMDQFRKYFYPAAIVGLLVLVVVYAILYGTDSVWFVSQFLIIMAAVEYPVFLHAAYWIANAFLVAQWDPSYVGRDSGTERTLPQMSDFRSAPLPQSLTPPPRLILQSLWSVVRGDPTLLVRCRNPVERLGCATLFMCVNRDGMLCRSDRVPEQVYALCDPNLLRDINKRKEDEEASHVISENDSEMNSAMYDSVDRDMQDLEARSHAASHASASPEMDNVQPVVFHVTYDESLPNKVCFSDPDWHFSLPLLKPIGLQLLFLSPSHDFYSGVLHPNRPWRDVCHLLALEMGFQDAVLDEFSLFSSRCAEEGTKCAFYELIVKEKEIASGDESAEEPEGQVLISGSSEAILAQCTEFFSGANIEELDSTTVSSIQHQCGHWLREEDLVPIAFAYRPLQRDNEPIDASSGSVGPPSEREGDLDVSRTDNPTACRSPTPQIHPSPSSDNVVFDDVPTIQTPLPPRHLSLEDVTVEEAPRAHAPCTSEDDAEPSPRIIPHILTGLLALGLRPRSSTPSFIDILSDCGIRFVFFCEENERRTKAFGAKLGLETGWNSCISLEASADVILLDDSDLKAHLPHGVASIVEHLDRTDDVPLKVSLFCDSRPDASADMVGIYQQNAEIVCCLGNVVSLRYLPVFLAADIAIGAAPYFLQDLTRPPQASVMFQLPHPRFYESATLSLYEARRVMNNVVLARSAWLAVLAFLLCFLTFVAALGVPPPLRGYEVLWLVCIVLPLLILPLVNTDVDPAILQTLQSKNRNVEHPGHYVTSFAVRFVPTAIFMSFVYVWLLQNMSDSSISYSNVMWQRNTYANEGSLVRDVEAVVLWLIVYYCVFLVSGFLHRTKSLTEFPAWKANRTWLAFAIFVLGIQSLYSGMLARGSLKNISVALYVTTLVGWPAVILLGTRYMKRVDAAIFRDYQKHLKIDFTTRLGMHSPV